MDDKLDDKYEICGWHPLVQGAVFLYIFSCRFQQFWQASYCVSLKTVLLRRHNTQCKKHFEHVAWFSNIIHLFFFDWKAFCVHINTWIWNSMDTLAIKIVDMLVGTVYNKWGRCVSIKYSLLWYNHTKYEKKNPVICWRKTLIFKWLYNKNKWWGISCIHTLLWLYTGRLVRYLHSRRLLKRVCKQSGGTECNVCRTEYKTINKICN